MNVYQHGRVNDRGIPCPTTCVVCNHNYEDVIYILFECPNYEDVVHVWRNGGLHTTQVWGKQMKLLILYESGHILN